MTIRRIAIWSGFVAETNATHLFLVANGMVITPQTFACREGITQATVLESCRTIELPCEVRDVSLAKFHRGDEVFCSGTMGELAPVVEIDGREIGHGDSGRVYRRLAAAFRELVQSQGTVVGARNEAARGG